MAEPVSKLMPPDEFFVWHPLDEGRWELVDGLPVRIRTGANQYHDRIVVNIIVTLVNQLRGKPCQPWTADTGVRTRIESVRRPDVTVSCEEPRPGRYEADQPRLVV
jgi:Uma2 family endonuclease